jgi:hypothetical protein
MFDARDLLEEMGLAAEVVEIRPGERSVDHVARAQVAPDDGQALRVGSDRTANVKSFAVIPSGLGYAAAENSRNQKYHNTKEAAVSRRQNAAQRRHSFSVTPVYRGCPDM